ncbi:MAG: hypothetical protein AB9842_09085 [Bacteroidales bacterium]
MAKYLTLLKDISQRLSINISMLLVISFLFIILSSCKKDIPPALHCDGTPADQICREDGFRRGQFLGYIEYVYHPNQQLYQKKYFSSENSYLEETYEYNNKNLLIYKKGVDKDGKTTEEKLIDHTEFDSISTVTVIRNGFTAVFTACEYDSLNRLKYRYDYEDGIMQKREYRYGDDGNLYSETVKDENDNIVTYKLIKPYFNHVIKVFTYNNEEELVSVEVNVYDERGSISEIRKFDSHNNLKSQETFLYQNNKLIKHAWLTGNYETEFRLFHYP